MESLKSMTEMQKIVGAFVVGIVVGATGFWAVQSDLGGRMMDDKSSLEEDSLDSSSSEENSSDVSTEENSSVTLSEEENNDASLSTPTLVVSTSNQVAADNQVAGDTVSVKLVQLSSPGWVVIHEDRAGSPGNILGASWYPEGIHLASVSLLRGTVSGGTYYAMLHSDDGDKKFDHTKDTPLLNSSGSPIVAKFLVE